MNDMVASVMTFEALESGTLDPFQGRAMHSLFMDLLGNAAPAQATALHDADELKPFTVSNLIGLRSENGAMAVVPVGAVFRWRVTVFEPELAELWAGRVLTSLPKHVLVGGLRFAVRKWTTDGAEDGWAGASSYASLIHQHTLAEQPPSSWINLRFASLTTFHSAGVHVPLPVPRFILGHWLEKWNAFSPLALPAEVRGFAEHEVVVNRYDLHTERVQFGKAKIIGFVGQCSLTVQRQDPYWRRIPHLLAAYSFWCGTGHRTPYGLGQTRPGT